MERNRTSIGRLAATLAAGAVIAAACTSGSTSPPAGGSSTPVATSTPATSGGASASPGGSPSFAHIGGSVSVLAVWGGSEQQQFLDMIKPWEDATGVTVNYTGTRDEPTVLTTALAAGGSSLPDIAGLPGPAQMTQYANAGQLQDLSSALDMNSYKANTPSSLVDLGTVNGKVVGIFLDVSAKGQIWYDPKVVGDLSSTYPKTWTDFQTLMTTDASKAKDPWCMTVNSGAASGWPATDILESIVLHTQGPDYYNNWWAGKVKWTDPGMVTDWQLFGQMVAGSYGGASYILNTDFSKAGDPLFTTPPGCLFLHEASFITGLGQFANETKLTDYNFFPFPSITDQYSGAVEGAGDLFGMFHNTPQAASLMNYLVSAQAQTLFVGGGEFLSANKQVANYPNSMNQALGAILSGATSFVFDASDQMPTAMQTAFYKATLNYIQNPSQLNTILAGLDTTQASAYTQ
ncbi:MAG TPA: hypothetical protein VMH24_00835 [Candidatus Sulfotelmatobacter sp.]|nr:hypothetical protein [Candidatus Sulfotelmatobacter sp.]